MIRRSPRYHSPAPNNVPANENPDNGITEQSTPGAGNVSSEIYATSANTSSNMAISNAANVNNGKRIQENAGQIQQSSNFNTNGTSVDSQIANNSCNAQANKSSQSDSINIHLSDFKTIVSELANTMRQQP